MSKARLIWSSYNKYLIVLVRIKITVFNTLLTKYIGHSDLEYTS